MTSKDSAAPSVLSEHRFVSFDKTPIFFRTLKPAEQPAKALLVIVHGMAEHGGRYLPLAEYLAALGVVSYLPDLRGFGQSGGKRGCLEKFSDYYQDLAVVQRIARERENFEQLFFLAHSYGGLVISCFLAENKDVPAKGLILSSPNFGIGIPVPAWRQGLAFLASKVLPDYTQSNRVNPVFLTHDLEICNQHAKDPLIHDRISARLYTELLSQISQIDKTASKIRTPSLILQAGDDRIVSRESTSRFFKYLAAEDKELEILDGLYHEILNEISRYSLFHKISTWLLDRA